MRTLSLPHLLLVLVLALGGCAPRVHLTFPVREITVAHPAEVQTPLHGVTTTFGGQIPVFVGRSVKPQTLSLMSNSPAIWHVYLLPGANVSAIYVGGYDPHEIVVEHARSATNDSNPQIVDLGENLRSHESLSFGPPMRLDGDKGGAYRDELRTETSLELSGFVSREQVWPGEAIAVSMNEPPSDELIRSEFPEAVERKSGSPDEELEAIREDLGALVARGVLAERMPQFNDNDALPPDQVHTWQLIDDESVSRSVPENSDCGPVQLGSANDEALWCDKGEGYEASTSWVIAGDGRDILSDYGHELSQVLSGGPGDDIIDADLGNDVLYFGRGWGRDIAAIRCEGGAPEPGGVPRYRDSRYVVFGRGVRPADLTWISSNEIEDQSTGSRIRFVEEPCAHFLAVEPGDVPAPPSGESTAIPPVPPSSWVMQ